MRILLPPSEGKTAPADSSSPVDLDGLLAPELHSERAAAVKALSRMCGRDPATAAASLKLGKGLQRYVDINQRLVVAPAAPAWRIYTGVLFDALRYGDLGDAGRERIVIFSGLWGVLRPEDEIPDYRCPAGAQLPDLNATAARYWRRRLDDVLPELFDGEFILDLRSQEYQNMWRPPPRIRCAAVRVLHERTVDGRLTRSVVSHFNKATKGRIAGDLLSSGDQPTSVSELIDALRALKYRAELSRHGQVDVITTEL